MGGAEVADEAAGQMSRRGVSDEGEGVGGGRDVLLQEVPGADLYEAGGRAVGTGEPFAFRYGAVHHEMDVPGLREDSAQDGGSSDLYAGEGL